jgi:hypothetical protein
MSIEHVLKLIRNRGGKIRLDEITEIEIHSLILLKDLEAITDTFKAILKADNAVIGSGIVDDRAVIRIQFHREGEGYV